jgi:outer membrane receptor for ferrienterochelin and colicins
MLLPLALSLVLAQADAGFTPTAEGDAGPSPAPELSVEVATAPVDAGLSASEPALSPPDAGAPEPFERVHQTVVTGNRTERRLDDVVVPTEVITRTQIERTGARDLAQLLQQQPGVELVYTNRGTGLRLQGLDPEYVLVLVDGQRVAGRAGAMTDISRFGLREVERVEIVKGPGAAVYGADAIGGVVNLVTRRPQKQLEGSVRGMFGTQLEKNTRGGLDPRLEGDVRANLASKLDAFELRAGGGYRTRDPYDWEPADVANSGPGIRRIDGDVDVSYNPSDKFRAWARSGYVFTDLNAVDLNDTGAVFDRYQRTEQFDGWLGVTGAPAEGTTVTARGHFGLFRDQFMLDQRGSRALDDYTQNLTRMWEAFAQAEHRLGRHQLSLGVEGIFENLSSSRIDPSFVARRRGGAFVQDTWTPTWLGSVLVVEPGFRFDLDSQFGGAPSPRLAIKVDPAPAFTVRASWGLGFRPPSFSELYLQFANPGIGYVVKGNPDLKPEKSNSFNLSVDYRPPLEGWIVTASAWRTQLTNLINISAGGIPNPDDPVRFGYENVADAYTQGIELQGRLRLSRGTSLELGYMFLDARDVTRQRALEGRSNHRVTAQVSSRYRPLGLEGSLRGSWASGRPFYVGQGLGFANVLGLDGVDRIVYAPSYFDLEAQVSYSLFTWAKVLVNGYNLLNTGDQNFNPRPPRGVLAGIQLDL